MSQKATMEYVGAKRRAYSALKSKKAKSAAIDEFCQITGAERKYAIRLLNGSRRYREHAGRGKTYTAEAEALFLRLWRASGYANPAVIRRLTALREKTNPIRLLEDIRHRHGLILRKQDKLARPERQGKLSRAPLQPEYRQDGGAGHNPRHAIAETAPSSDSFGVQYLTDRQHIKKNYGVFSI